MRRAQVSVEYLLILAFTFAILIPGIYFFSGFSQQSSTAIAQAQYQRIGQEMLATAEQALAQGESAWLTIEASIPDDVLAINISSSGGEIVIVHDAQFGESRIIIFSDITLSNSTSGQQDGDIFLAEPHPGRANFRFTALDGGVVAIQERYS